MSAGPRFAILAILLVSVAAWGVAEEASPTESPVTLAWETGTAPLNVTVESIEFHEVEIKEATLRKYQSRRFTIRVRASNAGDQDAVAIVDLTLQNREGEPLQEKTEKRKLKSGAQNKDIKISFRGIPEDIARDIESYKLEFSVEKDS
jgi:hypothetical protein